MLTRILNYLKAAFGIKLDQWEDPEVLLKQAQDEMAEMHRKNKERAVQAITQRNLLQDEVNKTNQQVQNLQSKAELALKNGNRDLARQLLVEKQTLEAGLPPLTASLEKANEITEQLKVTMKREEEAIRARAAQAMMMKTQLKQAQIENSINKALDKMESVGNQDEAFQRAQAKIGAIAAESSARTELGKTRMSTQIADLGDLAASSAADDELAKMEQRLGLAPAPAPTTTAAATSNPSAAAAAAAAASAEQELAQLEQQLGAQPHKPSV